MSAVLSISLAIVAALCFVGALHPAYDDNLLQRVGMGCICIACVALIEHVMRHGSFPPACALMSGGMLTFASGVVVKVWKYRRKPSSDEKHQEVRP